MRNNHLGLCPYDEYENGGRDFACGILASL